MTNNEDDIELGNDIPSNDNNHGSFTSTDDSKTKTHINGINNDDEIKSKKKKIKINPFKLIFILIVVVTALGIVLLQQLVPPFDDAFDKADETITKWLKSSQAIAFAIWGVSLVAKSFGIKDPFSLKRAALISGLAPLFDNPEENAATIAFLTHLLNVCADTITFVFEFKFVGIESQSVNTSVLQYVFYVCWNIVYYCFVFPIKWISNKCCNKENCCVTVAPMTKQNTIDQMELNAETINKMNNNNNDNNNSDNNDTNNDNNCCNNATEYLRYDNYAYKLVGKVNIENEITIIEFLRKSPYCFINRNLYMTHISAVIMLVFNGLSFFSDAVFFLFPWVFGCQSIGIIASYNFLDAESYLKSFLFAKTFLNEDEGSFAAAVFLTNIIDVGGKIIGVLFTYLINIIIVKPIVNNNPKLYDYTDGITFDIDGYTNENDNNINNNDYENPQSTTTTHTSTHIINDNNDNNNSNDFEDRIP